MPRSDTRCDRALANHKIVLAEIVERNRSYKVGLLVVVGVITKPLSMAENTSVNLEGLGPTL